MEMANRRMFSKQVTESDKFTELSPAAQALYFHLGMLADDDGFTDSVRHAMFNAQAEKKDLQTLEERGFIICFDSGVCVIAHWKLNNLIKNDRYHETIFGEERAEIIENGNGEYKRNI